MPVSHGSSSVLTSTDEQVPGLLEVLAHVTDPRRKRPVVHPGTAR